MKKNFERFEEAYFYGWLGKSIVAVFVLIMLYGILK